MCDGQYQPSGVVSALAMLDRALDHLATVDAASLPTAVQAEVLRALERAGAKHTATRGRVLAAFAAQAGYEDDGHGSARTWLKWQARVTAGAAAGAVGWARRLAAHPVMGRAGRRGLSESWARRSAAGPTAARGTAGRCGWIWPVPPAAAQTCPAWRASPGRCTRRSHRDGSGDGADDGFADRSLWLGLTFGGAGRLAVDLTPVCSATLSAVLEALGKRAGSEDLRTAMQRRHDALEEACRRLIRSGMLPGRAGQPTQVLVHMTLGQLRGIPGASPAEDAWAALRASQPGWLTGPDAEAAVCDATVVPIVTGHVDWAALDMLTEILLAATASPPAGPSPADPDAGSGATAETSPGARSGATAETSPGAGSGGSAIVGPHPGAGLPHEGARKACLPHELARKAESGGSAGCKCRCGGCTCLVREPLSRARRSARPP
jgi:hypothetical protein